MTNTQAFLQTERIERVALKVGFEYVRYKWVGPDGNALGWYDEEDLRQMATKCREVAELPDETIGDSTRAMLVEVADFIENELRRINEKGGARA